MIKYIYIYILALLYKVRGLLDRIKIIPYISAPQSPPERYTIVWTRRTLHTNKVSILVINLKLLYVDHLAEPTLTVL